MQLMNNTTVNLLKVLAGAIAVLGVAVSPASADHYASKPPEPSLDKPTGQWYITNTIEGTDFYALTPFNSSQKADQSLYVTSGVMLVDPRFMGTKFLQIDCSRLRYREILPGLAMDREGKNSTSVPPETYGWQRFKQDTAFLEVGKALCSKAASDRGRE
jgi:hypothetical protein